MRFLPLAFLSLLLTQPETLPSTYRWDAGGALLGPIASSSDVYYAVKDPSLVFHGERWHVFVTVRGKNRPLQLEYVSFRSWEDTAGAERHFLQMTDGNVAAPQVFYFAPQAKWYLIYQTTDSAGRSRQPVFSTSSSVDAWESWTPPQPLFAAAPSNVGPWIDFWVICDGARAHLFFTSNDGRMWRAETTIQRFPFGWSEPTMVLRGDIFEASHTYKLRGRQQFLTLVEARRGEQRFYQAYVAPALDAAWVPAATTWTRPFAGARNVRETRGHWTDSVSHGELVRAGIDERMEIDPVDLRFVFQGVMADRARGRPYGEIPWRIGMLAPRPFLP